MTGKLRDKGLGTFEDVSLEQARARATECRALLSNGNDPIDSVRATVKAKRDAHASRISFKQCFERHYTTRKGGWKNEKHSAQWVSTVTNYCGALLDRPITEIDTEAVVAVLTPIWLKTPETARRVRQRIEAVIDWAKANGRYSGENPARLKGHIDKLLPIQPKDVSHRPAVPYLEIADFMRRLALVPTASASALMLQILTASRPNEAVAAKWEEFDLTAGVWVIPKERMKAKKPHSVPIAPQLLAILASMPRGPQATFLFPGKEGTSITTAAILKLVKQLYPSNPKITSHGFRSTFRDWAGAVSSHPSEVAEAALAHVISNKTEAAYARDKLFEKRRRMMVDWENYCLPQSP